MIDLAKKLKETMEHEIDDDTNCNWYVRYSYQKIGTRTGGFRDQRTCE